MTDKKKCPIDRAMRIAGALGMPIEEIWGSNASGGVAEKPDAGETVPGGFFEPINTKRLASLLGRRVLISQQKLSSLISLTDIARRFDTPLPELRGRLVKPIEFSLSVALLLLLSAEMGIDPTSLLVADRAGRE